jgi:hypothetical protein
MPSIHSGKLYSLSITVEKKQLDWLDKLKADGIGYSYQIRQLIDKEIAECQTKTKAKQKPKK